MKIKKFQLNPFSMNCYIYYDEASKDAVIIDPAAFTEDEQKSIMDFTESENLNVKYILNTHGHIDHILGNNFAKNYFKVPLYMHAGDEFMLENSKEQARFFGMDFPDPPPVDNYIDDKTSLQINGTELTFINTPGHSPGSVCIIDHKNKNVFCGDLIFKNSIGRTDLQGGNLNVLISSIKNKLFKVCANDYNLFPGHMESTNVKDERNSNPFLI
ncbi:MAG: MBL fold metallo-hydrolase [Bacteroidetes bacterium]|nr:MBL fold metallo-hydrolase [Bacteroidota bacterium]